jgi:hypothetical protein
VQARLSWFPLISLRAVFRWRAGRELFYRTAAKAAIVDGVISALALGALVSGIVCIVVQPLKEAGPILGLLVLVAPLAWRRRRWRALLYLSVAGGLLATCRSLAWPVLGLIVANLSAATLVAVEARLLGKWLFKPLHLGNTNVGSARLLRGRVEIAHLFLDTIRSWRVSHELATMNRVNSACRWLAKEGRRFDVRVEFSHRRIQVLDKCWPTRITVTQECASSNSFSKPNLPRPTGREPMRRVTILHQTAA